MKVRIGIDVGKNGGIAAIFEDGTVELHKTPQVAKEIDVVLLKEILQGMCESGKNDVLVGIEGVHNIAKVGSKENFQFGRALGILEGLVSGLGIPFVKIHPKKWQNHSFQGIPVVYKPGEDSKKVDTKAMALLAAKRLFPNTSFKASSRSKVDHDGIVDALLIARHIKDHY